MSFAKRFLSAAAPVALLALSACATGLPTQVSRFQAMPAPSGQTFYVQPANERDRGGLEFRRYADMVARAMADEGFTPAGSAAQASLIVSLDYGVDNGRTEVRSFGSGFGGGYGGFGYGGFGRPYYSRFGGLRSSFFYGFGDPFYDGFGGGSNISSYTVYTSFLDVDIRRRDGQSVFEGTAKARSRTDELQALVPPLVEALFTGFPGRSGETVRITVPTPPRTRR